MPKFSFLSARAFDPALAALAALSAGFVAFAMPESLLSSLVAATPLPELVPAAQPPLGETARLAAAGGALLLAFAAVWALMAVLGRAPQQSRPEAEPEAKAPRLRRADAHPDAPAPRPLLARDLGEPLDLDDFPQAPADEAPVEAAPRPLPGFLIPQAPDSEPIDHAAPEPGEGELQWGEPENPWADSAPQPVELEPAPEAGPRPISELAALLPEGEDESEQPLSQLVHRIEFGLSRKRQALPAAADLAPAGDASGDPENVGHRLRSAISDLQKIASRGG